MGRLTRDGVALAYEEAGSGTPPIVLVHDLGSDSTCFASQLRYFSRRHRVVAIDLRGHGQSGGPRGACAVELLAGDLAWLCYELGLYRPVLLGNGLGGKVALDLAARYPDLPSACVAVATASPAAVTFPEHGAGAHLDNAPAGDLATAALRCGVPVLRIAFHGGEAPQPEEVDELVEEFLSELADRALP
jgi:pimeloyl-ACP methyl ester carboxylesterase